MIAYVELYIYDDGGLFDVNLLPEPLKMFYEELRHGTKPVRQWTRGLKETLGILEDTEDDDGR